MILSNQVRCHTCNDTPFSTHVHDFRQCMCGAIAVDGGGDYLRRVGDIQQFTEMSITIPDAAGTAALAAIKWAKDHGRNDLGILCAVARTLRDNGVDLTTQEETV